MIDDTVFRSMCNSALEPFVRHIRFPHYKNLAAGARIDFTFPITALIGANGTNKSSVLKALFGVPGNNNLGQFWFSTKLDPIADTGDRPRFIYGYINQHAKKIVEVIKTRIHKEKNPDYWEPSRPLSKDGMEQISPLEEGEKPPPGRHQTRWANIEKEVVYVDFRAEISAYDKFFYHGELTRTSGTRTKQDFIRTHSSKLRQVVDLNLQSKSAYGKQKVYVNRLLAEDELQAVASILNRKYVSIRLVQHRFFKQLGYTIILQHNDLSYSEAFAGSGEFAAVMLVVRVCEAKPSSLILLDEPEVSLHPGAQDGLIRFLLEKIRTKHHQVVLATHSPNLIRDLPPDAIKTFYQNPKTGLVAIQNHCLPEEAFFHIGEPTPNTIRVLVEDRLGVEVVKRAIRSLGVPMTKLFEVVYVPGGAKTIFGHFIPVFSSTHTTNTLICLDGDQKPQCDIPDPSTIPSSSDNKLADTIKAICGVDVQFNVDGGKKGSNKEQLVEMRREFLDWIRKYVLFLPSKTPEQFIWENMRRIESSSPSSEDRKESFLTLTTLELGYLESDRPTSAEILETQKRALATIPLENDALKKIAYDLKEFATHRND